VGILAKKKVAPKAKVTIAIGKAPMMSGEPMDYSKMPKKAKGKAKKC
jgi:hypothetical protein